MLTAGPVFIPDSFVLRRLPLVVCFVLSVRSFVLFCRARHCFLCLSHSLYFPGFSLFHHSHFSFPIFSLLLYCATSAADAHRLHDHLHICWNVQHMCTDYAINRVASSPNQRRFVCNRGFKNGQSDYGYHITGDQHVAHLPAAENVPQLCGCRVAGSTKCCETYETLRTTQESS